MYENINKYMLYLDNIEDITAKTKNIDTFMVASKSSLARIAEGK